MEDTTDKINCPHCDYPIPYDEVICPVCDKIIANAPSEVELHQVTSEVEPHQVTSGELGKASTSSPYLHIYKTNPKIIMLLTGMFCFGIWLFVLFVTVEYERVLGNGYRYYDPNRLSFRQALAFIIIMIEASFVLGPPYSFMRFKYGFKKFFNGSRVSSVIFYSICMLAVLLFWHFYFGDLILTDLNSYYFNRFVNDYAHKFTDISSPQATENARIALEEFARAKAIPFVDNTFMFYKITYFLSTLFLFLPYIIYHAFGLDFDQYDTEPYSSFYNIALVIPSSFVVLYYWNISGGTFIFLLFGMICTCIPFTSDESELSDKIFMLLFLIACRFYI